MRIIDNAIFLDHKSTWPEKIINTLVNNENELKEYLKLEKKIDKIAETNISFRIQRPYNKYEYTFSYVKSEICSLLKDTDIVGYHCTRLIKDEIDEVVKNGLKPLSQELIKQKLDRLYEKDFINKKSYQILLNKNQSNDAFRKNKVCLFHTQSTFRDEWGLYRLFGLWGGESIYWYHNGNTELLKTLSYIGEPCIIVCKINANDIIDKYDIGFRIIKSYILKQKFEDFDSFNEHIIKVESLIKISDVIFEKVTHYSKWNIKVKT